MGASDSMRQGFVMSRPDMAAKTISVIGDSCECHSGLDSTRNSVFRNVPGVKIILDNKTTAMTGGQPAPSSDLNLEGRPHKFELKKAVGAEVEHTVVIDAFNLKEIEKELKKALELAGKGEFSVLILEGPCIQEVESKKKARQLTINYETCKKCGLCNICPGIEMDENKRPHFTNLCTNCGARMQMCLQCCPSGSIMPLEEESEASIPGFSKDVPVPESLQIGSVKKDRLPESLRVAIRGIGGQGNLFIGNVLSEVAMRTPYSDMFIVKGDTHGMAQLGGSVISTFCCGNVYSPIPAPNSVDVLIVMEVSEVLRPGFLDLLKPEGTIIFNTFKALPVNLKKKDYPDLAAIEKALNEYKVIKIDANKIAIDLGDKSGRIANVVVLGLLSAIPPFNRIPEEIWVSSIISVSSNERIKSANIKAFKSGRTYH